MLGIMFHNIGGRESKVYIQQMCRSGRGLVFVAMMRAKIDGFGQLYLTPTYIHTHMAVCRNRVFFTQPSRFPHVSHSSLLQFYDLVHIMQAQWRRKARMLGPCIFAVGTCHISSVRWIRSVWRTNLLNLVPAHSIKVPRIPILIPITWILDILISWVPSTRTFNHPLLSSIHFMELSRTLAEYWCLYHDLFLIYWNTVLFQTPTLSPSSAECNGVLEFCSPERHWGGEANR